VGVIAQEDYKVFSFGMKIQGLALMVLCGNFLVEDILSRARMALVRCLFLEGLVF
jgi:hypothetical protein